MGEINLTNSKGRDAVVSTIGVRSPLKVRWIDSEQRQAGTARLLKASVDREADALVAMYGSPSMVAEKLVSEDPEIDFEAFGSVLKDTSRVYIGPDREIVHSVQFFEVLHNPDGSVREKRPRKMAVPNTSGETPLKWSGKLMKKSQVYNKFVFQTKMQICHINGLTYDFLYGMAKELEAADSLLLVGAGPKSNQPLVFRRGGSSYRGFLEGRTQGDKYCLLIHLSNMELKLPEAQS